MDVCPKYVGSRTWLWLNVAVYDVSVHGYIYQGVRYLSSLSVCLRLWCLSDLFGCLFPRMRDFWFGCGCIFQGVSSLIYLGVYVQGVRFLLCCGYMSNDIRFLICLWVYISGYEVSDLFVIVCHRMWDLSSWVYVKCIKSLICFRVRVGVRVRVRIRVRVVIKPIPLSRYPLARKGILLGVQPWRRV